MLYTPRQWRYCCGQAAHRVRRAVHVKIRRANRIPLADRAGLENHAMAAGHEVQGAAERYTPWQNVAKFLNGLRPEHDLEALSSVRRLAHLPFEPGGENRAGGGTIPSDAAGNGGPDLRVVQQRFAADVCDEERQMRRHRLSEWLRVPCLDGRQLAGGQANGL